MNFDIKGYLICDDLLIPYKITTEMVSIYLKRVGIDVTEENISKYINMEYHYQYLEFFCKYFGLEFDQNITDNYVLYANYLDYILCINGYISLTIVKPDEMGYDVDSLPLYSKNKVYFSKPQTIMIVPDDFDQINELQKELLTNLRRDLENETNLDIYSYKKEKDIFNYKYNKHNVNHFFNHMAGKKKRLRFFR